jgi:hypothetical protein
MPFPTEQERKIGEEVQLIDIPNQFTFPTTYGTVHDYGNITLAKAGLVAVNFSIFQEYGVFSYQTRLSVGGIPFVATGARISGPSGSGVVGNYHAIAFLAAGTYNVLLEGKSSDAGKHKVQNFKLGYGNFQDLSGTTLAAYTAPLTVNTLSRATPLGTLARTTLYIRLTATTAGAVTNLENVGDALTNGVSVAIDGAQVSFIERFQDSDASYLNAASGLITQSYSAGADHTVAVSKRNAATIVNIDVVACPWILGTTADYPKTQFPFPVSALAVPQGSTLYVMLEPLSASVDKFIAVGKSRLVSHGITRDYYQSDTSAEIQVFSYTFEIVDAATACIVTNGVGGCISYIGVDLVT